MDNTQVILSRLLPLAIETSPRVMGNWGVLFNEADGVDEAWVVNDHFMLRWTDFGNLDFDRDFPFYSDECKWKANTFTVANNSNTNTRILAPVELLYERLESLRPKTEEEIYELSDMIGIPPDEVNPGNYITLRLPFPNLYNMIWEMSKEKRRRSRVIILPKPYPEDYVDPNRIILQVQIHNGALQFKLPDATAEQIPGYDISKFYKIIETEKYNRKTLVDGALYECEFEGYSEVNDENLYSALDVEYVIPRKRIFKGTEILLHYSRAGFLMFGETMDDVVNSELYLDNDVLRVPFIQFCEEDINLNMYNNLHPIMFDCFTLFQILEVYRTFKFQFLDFHISPNEFAPVLIEGVRENKNFPTIQTVLTTLGESVGDIG